MANPSGTKYFLERPRARARLVRMLAVGWPVAAAARVMECSAGAISMFRTRHAAEIKQMQAGITDATDHLWIAHRANRVAALDQTYEDLQDYKQHRIGQQTNLGTVPAVTPQTHGYEAVETKYYGKNKVEVHRFDAPLLASELRVLRAAAEELGQLPQPGSAVQTNILLQQTNNQQVNFFDRASVLALAARLRSGEKDEPS